MRKLIFVCAAMFTMTAGILVYSQTASASDYFSEETSQDVTASENSEKQIKTGWVWLFVLYPLYFLMMFGGVCFVVWLVGTWLGLWSDFLS